MKELWVTKEATCELMQCTDRNVQRLASTGKLVSRLERTRRRNGQRAKEFLFSSLPDEARQRYLDGQNQPEEEIQPERRPSSSPLSLAPLFAGSTTAEVAPVQTPIRVALPPKAEAEAARRLTILKPLLEYSRDPSGRPHFHHLRLADGEAVSNADSLVRYLAEQHHVSASAIWSWNRRFKSAGSTALARKPRVDKNRSTWAASNRELADLAALLYMGTPEQPAQSVQVCFEYVCERAGRMGVPSPSYETVRSFLRNPEEVSPSMLKYGRDGKRKYEAVFAPYISRGYTEPAYSIVVSDHRIHDVLVADDVFKCDLKHIRVQTTTLEDFRSRFIVGWACTLNGSSHSIKRALRRAWQKYGLFDRFLCDNGKDYRSVAKGSRDQEMEANWRRGLMEEMDQLQTGVLERVGIPTTFCIPFSPKAKPVERFHDVVRRRFDSAFPTYTGSAPHLRPDSTVAALAQHGKLLQMNRTSESQLPLASAFIEMYGAWVKTWYNHQPQDGLGMDGCTPAQVFEAERGPVRACPDDATLAMLMCERVRRKVSNMQLELDGDSFTADGADRYAQFKMHEYGGRYVSVAYDPLDPMVAYVLDADGNFVCRIQRKNLMRFSNDQETRDGIGDFMQTRNGLAKAVRESRADLNRRVNASGGFTSLVEQHRMRLPRAVGDGLADAIVQAPQRPTTSQTFKETHSEDNALRYFERMREAN